MVLLVQTDRVWHGLASFPGHPGNETRHGRFMDHKCPVKQETKRNEMKWRNDLKQEATPNVDSDCTWL